MWYFTLLNGCQRMEGDPSWTTVDRKPSKKKAKEKEEKPSEEGWSQVAGKDRRKKDSATLGRPDRNNDRRGERRVERGGGGKPPAGGRGGANNQRNTLPRRGRGGGEGVGRGSMRSSPSPVPHVSSKPPTGMDLFKWDNVINLTLLFKPNFSNIGFKRH